MSYRRGDRCNDDERVPAAFFRVVGAESDFLRDERRRKRREREREGVMCDRERHQQRGRKGREILDVCTSCEESRDEFVAARVIRCFPFRTSGLSTVESIFEHRRYSCPTRDASRSSEKRASRRLVGQRSLLSLSFSCLLPPVLLFIPLPVVLPVGRRGSYA